MDIARLLCSVPPNGSGFTEALSVLHFSMSLIENAESTENLVPKPHEKPLQSIH